MNGPVRVRLAQLAHARSGDKADRSDIGLYAWDAAGYAVLERCVTAERVSAHFAHLAAPGAALQVDRYELPNLLALKFVLNGALGGGAARSLRSDNLGKTIGAQLLRMTIEIEANESQVLREARPGVHP
jgi:hypothetical protein